MKLFLAAAALAALTTTALAGPQVQQVIYNVDAVSKCSQADHAETAGKKNVCKSTTAGKCLRSDAPDTVRQQNASEATVVEECRIPNAGDRQSIDRARDD